MSRVKAPSPPDHRRARKVAVPSSFKVPVMIGSLLGRWDKLPLAGVVLTSIDKDGTLGGPDLKALARARAMTSLTLQYSGGVTSLEDIGRVAAAGAQAVIIGKALYEGKFTLEQALAT